MANKKLTELSELTTAASLDKLYIVDASDLTDGAAGSSKYIKPENLLYRARTAAELAAGVTPTNLKYEPGNVLRYGTNTTPGTTPMQDAFTAAIAANDLIYNDHISCLYCQGLVWIWQRVNCDTFACLYISTDVRRACTWITELQRYDYAERSITITSFMARYAAINTFLITRYFYCCLVISKC